MLQTRLLKQIKRKYGRQLLPAYHLYRGLAVCPPARTARQKQRLLDHGDLGVEQRQLLAQTSSYISPRDTMYDGDGAHYFRVGLSAVDCIDEALAATDLREIKTVLDLPCGHGRVLRVLKSRFPDAKFTACEIDHDGVEFCQCEFGAEPAYSRLDLENLTLGSRFDLIWCGSLMTHLTAEDIQKLLVFFHRHLVPGGLLVFSAHGTFVVDRLRTNHISYGLADDEIAQMLKAHDETGYGYAEYPEVVDGYGLCLTSRPWIETQVQAIGGWQLVYFAEQKWDHHHDVYGVRRTPD
jgi:SAM-dependent methyltransferase